VEQYNETIAENPKVEMVHVSLDRSESSAVGWAKKEKFPWLTILPDDVKTKSGVIKFKQGSGVPSYVLLKADGEVISTGSGVFEKARALNQE